MLTKMAEKFSGTLSQESSTQATAEAASLQNKISTTLTQIHLELERLEATLCALDANWPDGNPNALCRIAAEFSFLSKWRESLRSARTRLLGG